MYSTLRRTGRRYLILNISKIRGDFIIFVSLGEASCVSVLVWKGREGKEKVIRL